MQNKKQGHLEYLGGEDGSGGSAVHLLPTLSQCLLVAITLSLPHFVPASTRDPRSTMNAIYYPEAVQLLLDMAKEEKVPLLFVTNNVCNEMFKFEDSSEVVKVRYSLVFP